MNILVPTPDSRTNLAALVSATWRVAVALPLMLLALLFLGMAAALAAAPEPSTCDGTNLVDGLKADGKYEAVERKVAETVNGEGKFYGIDKPGRPRSYLFGTMHLADERVLTLDANVEKAFDEARRLIIETTDVVDPLKAAGSFLANPALMNLPTDKTLKDYLSADQLAELKSALDERGIPFEAIHTLQPWFTSMNFMMPACQLALEEKGGSILDVWLANRAAAMEKPVEGLETAKEQLEALASLPMDLQVESLLATLKLRDRIPDIMATMMELYLQGKIGAIMPSIEAAVPDGGMLVGQGEGYSNFEKTVVTDRNETMSKRLEPYLIQGGAFIAVGALHLPGKDGLVEKLRNEGYEVQRLD